VAWWDPNVLALEVEENVGVRQQRILEADESGAEVARGEQAYNQWKADRSAAVAKASQSTIRVQTATAFAAGVRLGDQPPPHIQIEAVLRADTRPAPGRGREIQPRGVSDTLPFARLRNVRSAAFGYKRRQVGYRQHRVGGQRELRVTPMRYEAKSSAALQMALGSLPDKMRVEVDPGIQVSEKTVGELRKITAWPENLAVTTPQERHADSAVRVSKVSIATRTAPKQ
jgi:hypothetical protein